MKNILGIVSFFMSGFACAMNLSLNLSLPLRGGPRFIPDSILSPQGGPHFVAPELRMLDGDGDGSDAEELNASDPMDIEE